MMNVRTWFNEKFDYQNIEGVDPSKIPEGLLKPDGLRILIWRDFDDWLASFILMSYDKRPTRNLKDVPDHIRKTVQVYHTIREEAENPQYFNAHCVIHYDEFVDSKAYRQNKCRNLNGTYNEEKLNFVPLGGGGSSFDKRSLDGKGSEMKVLSRAEQILNTQHKDLFLNIMKQNG